MTYLKQSIIKILSESDFDDSLLNVIHMQLVHVDEPMVKMVSEYLKDGKFKNHMELSRIICSLDHSDSARAIMINPLKLKDFPKQKKFNLLELLSDRGIIIGADLIDFLLNYKESSNKNVGKGETLLRFISRGTPLHKGDVLIDRKKIEVKFNLSRLRGMTSFQTDATGVAESLDTAFGIGNWHFYKGKDFYLNSLGLTNGNSCDGLVKAYNEYFVEMTDSDRKDLLRGLRQVSGVRSDNDYPEEAYVLCAFALKYYQRHEEFDGIFFINETFDCMYIPSRFIINNGLNELSDFIKTNFSIRPPNLSKKAGAQGSSFGLSLL